MPGQSAHPVLAQPLIIIIPVMPITVVGTSAITVVWTLAPTVVGISVPPVTVTSVPPVVMTSVPPIMTTSATTYSDDRVVSAGKRTRVYTRHCRCWQGWSQRKGAGCKSDQQKPLHDVFPPWIVLSGSTSIRDPGRVNDHEIRRKPVIVVVHRVVDPIAVVVDVRLRHPHASKDQPGRRLGQFLARFHLFYLLARGAYANDFAIVDFCEDVNI